MKKIMIMMALLFVAGSSVSVMAQNNADRNERIQQRADRLARDMKIEKGKVEKFVALYTEYQNALMAVRADKSASLQPRNRNIIEMTDAKADSLIKAGFAQSEKEIILKKEFYKKMKADFTPSQLVHVFGPQRNDVQRMQRNRNFNGGGREGGFDRPSRDNFGDE